MKLKKIVKSMQSVCDALEDLAPKIQTIKELYKDFLELEERVKELNGTKAIIKSAIEDDTMYRMLSEKVPTCGWEELKGAKWSPANGWIKVESETNVQYFKLKKIEVKYEKED